MRYAPFQVVRQSLSYHVTIHSYLAYMRTHRAYKQVLFCKHNASVVKSEMAVNRKYYSQNSINKNRKLID